MDTRETLASKARWAAEKLSCVGDDTLAGRCPHCIMLEVAAELDWSEETSADDAGSPGRPLGRG